MMYVHEYTIASFQSVHTQDVLLSSTPKQVS